MKILSVQYLRGLAALLVVVAHNALLLPDGMAAHIPGALGVDIFFIISGFIMTFITAHSAERPLPFLIKRFFRIWPVFFLVWLAAWTLVYSRKMLRSPMRRRPKFATSYSAKRWNRSMSASGTFSTSGVWSMTPRRWKS